MNLETQMLTGWIARFFILQILQNCIHKECIAGRLQVQIRHGLSALSRPVHKKASVHRFLAKAGRGLLYVSEITGPTDQPQGKELTFLVKHRLSEGAALH